MKIRRMHPIGIKITLLLASVTFCLIGHRLIYQSVFGEYKSLLLSLQWVAMICLAICCSVFLFFTISLKDTPLIGLLLITLAVDSIDPIEFWQVSDYFVLLSGITLGKGALFFLKSEKRRREFEMFLVGLILLLASSSFWRPDISNNYYNGPRWTGPWNNPNTYGMLMAAGTLLATGVVAGNWNSRIRSHTIMTLIILLAIAMMVLGLIFSYSRGAWLGMVVGSVYLGNAYRKIPWRWFFWGVVASAVVLSLFRNTPDTAPWYVKRLDLTRGSIQHRYAAWRGGFEIMRDHPLGIGWNETVEFYQTKYSPPEDSAFAILTNDYLMLGTQLGVAALLSFLVYISLCFRRFRIQNSQSKLSTACRAGTLSMLVAFWCDGGLFILPTASVFWILLELGSDPSDENCDYCRRNLITVKRKLGLKAK